MDNTIQLYVDEEREIKGYPITSPDRVIDENGVNIKEEIEEINSSLDNITNRIVNLENNGTGGGGLELEDVIEGEVFTSIIQTYPCESLTLSNYTLNFDNLSSQTIITTVTPTNCTDKIMWSVSPLGIVNVSDGVVTPITNGNCVITATCGDKIKTCSVNVNVSYSTTYSITNNLTNVINSNSVTTVIENTSYSATLSANEGYKLSTVTVIMDGFDITSLVYSEGNINIPSVTGNVIINAIANVVNITSEPKATTDIINGTTYLVVDDILSIKDANLAYSPFKPNSYKNENYQIYSTNTIAFKTIWDMTNGKPFGDTIPYVSVANSSLLLTDTNTGDLCSKISGTVQIRIPLNLDGYSTVEEYLENKYKKLMFPLLDTVQTKVIDPSKITKMTIKTSNNDFQYAQFSYSDLPNSNIYNGSNSLFVVTGTNANLSGVVVPTASMSTSTLSISFKAGTFEEFTLDNVKEYLTINPLVFWYK